MVPFSPKIICHFQKCPLISSCMIWCLGGHCFPSTPPVFAPLASHVLPPNLLPWDHFSPSSCMPNLISVRILTDRVLAERAILVPPKRWLSSGRYRDFHFQEAQKVAGQGFQQKHSLRESFSALILFT